MTKKPKPAAGLPVKVPSRKPTSRLESTTPAPANIGPSSSSGPADLHSLSDALIAHASPLSLVHPTPELEPEPVRLPTRKGRKAPARPAMRFAGAVAPQDPGSTSPEQTSDAKSEAGVPESAKPTSAAAATSASSAQTALPPPDVVGSAAEDVAVPPPPADLPPASAELARDDGGAADADASVSLPDVEAMARTMGRLIEHSGKAAAAYLQRDAQDLDPGSPDAVQTLNSLGRVAESWITNPARMVQAQATLTTQLFALWNNSFARFAGAKELDVPRVADKRFAAPEWRETPFFDFLHQAYLLTTEWAKAMVADADNIDRETRDQAAFYLRQITSALSPSNFLATNPELLKATFKEKGENLVRGMQMLAEDIEAGRGELKIRQSDTGTLKLGVDMASTPGKVVFRNDLMELIQYAPTTEHVLKQPLLIVPPWINKFYVLDLNREKSLVRWMVSEGVTVFVISWVNPDERHAQKDWDAYMREGIFAALDAIEQATGEREVSTVGYCVGGTLLAATLAYMAARDDRRITSSTFLTTQVDFKEAGDLKVFADEGQIRTVERQMAKTGYLDGSRMANAFNMLRPDDLIWSYSVNTYLKGQKPKPFDLLTWNADATRMSAANHAFYLRNCYLENNLARGEMVIGGEKLNLSAVTIPIYDLAAKEDHIAPARSVFTGSKLFGGPVRYVMAGSGHIAGVVNPPGKAKYQFWSEGRSEGSFEDWVASAKETPGTWWLDWIGWLRAQAPETVPARRPGEGGLEAICDAPGEYVLVQS